MGQALPILIPPLTFSIDGGTIVYHWIRGKIRSSEKRIDSIDDVLTKKDVTIIISTHGNQEGIEEIVRHAFEQTYPTKNVYLSDSDIDNTKGVIERLSREFPNLHYWSKKGLTGKAEKINSLVRDPNVDLGDYIYLQDSNTRLAPDVVEKLVSGFTKDNIAAVTSFGFVTPPDNYFAKYFHYGKEWTNRLGKFRKSAQQYRRAMFVVCGASFMVRSDVLKKIEIPIGTKTEDTGYTWKLQEEGYKVGVVQDAIVHAADVSNLKAQLKQSFRWYTGTWQNIYLHKRELFGLHSKSKALAYSTILPGFIESSLYTATIVSLPVIYHFSPDFARYFLIGDTILSLASPFISTALDGNPKEGPREFLKTVRHYHQIMAYKVMSSVLWICSGVKVAYDVLTGKSKEWSSRWEKLPEEDSNGIIIQPRRLTKKYMKRNFNQFTDLEGEWTALGEMPWNEEKFFLPKPKKWELSSYFQVDGKLVGYTIVSEPEERKGFLHKIIVDSDYQGKGIGSRLFQDAIERCRNVGIGQLNFKVRTDNESAKAIYKKYGVVFTVTEIGKDGIERYLCELKLK